MHIVNGTRKLIIYVTSMTSRLGIIPIRVSLKNLSRHANGQKWGMVRIESS